PASGCVRLAGEMGSRDGAILRPPEERGVAIVFQDLALWPHLTVRGNLAFGLASQGVPRRARDERVGAMLERVGLSGRAGRHPGELSGGERQRVAIARAPRRPPVPLAEPLSNLDAALKRELLALFRALLGERGTTAIYVTHDLREAAAVGDRIAVMEAGRVVQEGALATLRQDPATPFVRGLLDD